jgi:peptide deformylase
MRRGASAARRDSDVLRPILRYGASDLHAPARPVPAITAETQALIDDMIETMYAAPGIGLAAPQIGVAQRIFVVDLSVGRASKDLVVMVNPEFIERDGTQLEEEGCLSVPGFNATVLRPLRVVCGGLDRDGREQRIEGTQLLARAFQHEMDHLDGTLFVDRLRGIKRDMIVRRIQKLKKSGRW